MTLMIFFLIIIHGVFSTAEQICFKKSADHLENYKLSNFGELIWFIFNALKIPAVWLGFGCIAVSWTVWFVVLANIELSVAVCVDSMQFVLILFASYIFLKERMHWTRVAGTILILCGVYLVAR
ncbi:MAG: EamA family transporter [Candidatus Omnitrophica bacterium]|nr:EamA family transporter [Candidatus Omnitrophota bacterium]